jgi:hypothetical protein
MTTREKIALYNDKAIMWDNLDGAVIGITDEGSVVYDIDEMIQILRKDMSEEDAIEWVDFNILGAHVGDYTPVHIHKINEI